MSTNVAINNCNLWVQYVYGGWLAWLRMTRPDLYYLRESSQILVGRMRTALNQNLGEETWNLLERLKKIGDSIQGMGNEFGGNKFLYEQAEINLECAVVAYQLGDMQEARALLEKTNGSFVSRTFHKAVCCWISGCIQWQSPSHFDMALVNWEKGHQSMSDLALSSSSNQSFTEECEKIAGEMENAIREASIIGFPPPPPRTARPQSNPGPRPSAPPSPNPGPSPRRQNPGGNPSYPASRLRIFPVIGSIPAGSPIGIVDDSNDEAAIDGLEINGYYYKIHGLIGAVEINANQNSRYFILKVKGNSMNNAAPINIDDGDYVLMVKQDTAEAGDIVAAEIKQVDREATLKRYSFKNGEFGLFPESRSPANIHLTYKKDFYIRGKVVAVLKRDG